MKKHTTDYSKFDSLVQQQKDEEDEEEAEKRSISSDSGRCCFYGRSTLPPSKSLTISHINVYICTGDNSFFPSVMMNRILSKWCYIFKSGRFSIESHGDVGGSDEPIVRFSFARLRTTPTALSWGTSARKSSSVMGSWGHGM